MDFHFKKEEIAFVAQVRAFLDAQATRDDANEIMAPQRDAHAQIADSPERRAFNKRLAAQGYIGMSWPKEFGGQERDGIYEYLLNEELALRGMPQIGKGVGCVGKTIIRHGSDGMKAEFLPKILAADIEFAIGYSEPSAGSDLASLTLKAVLEGDEWVLNGQKMFSTSAHFADWYWLAARTDPDAPKHKGISLFLVPMKHPGITIHELKALGRYRTNQVFLDNVRLPRTALVGEVNKGWTYICEALDFERFTMWTLNPLLRKFERAMEALRTTRRNGRELSQDPTIRRDMARLAVDLETVKMFQIRVLAEASAGRVPTIEAAMFKLKSTRLGQQLTNFVMDALGPPAILLAGSPDAVDDGIWAQFYQTTTIDTIAGGSSEIQKNIIARRKLGLPLT
jgi:3-oxocholest-4-en-26-oyl-CoA dehydrogenase alpha subunit